MLNNQVMSETIENTLETKLKAAGIPFNSVRVLGTSIIIKADGRLTAERWERLLKRMGCWRVKSVETFDHAKENKNTVLVPSVVRRYLIGGAI